MKVEQSSLRRASTSITGATPAVLPGEGSGSNGTGARQIGFAVRIDRSCIAARWYAGRSAKAEMQRARLPKGIRAILMPGTQGGASSSGIYIDTPTFSQSDSHSLKLSLNTPPYARPETRGTIMKRTFTMTAAVASVATVSVYLWMLLGNLGAF